MMKIKMKIAFRLCTAIVGGSAPNYVECVALHMVTAPNIN